MIKAAIFDLDGTLLDSMPLWLNAGEMYLEKLNIKSEKDLGSKLLEMTMEEGAVYLKKEYKLFLSVKEICEGINNLLKENYAFSIQLKPYAFKLLSFLKENGCKIALCTNTSASLFEKALERLKIAHFFDYKITTETFGSSKAKPDIFLHTAEVLGLKPEETYVFEDALYAIKTAKKAGFKIAGVFDNSSKSAWTEIKKLSDIVIENEIDLSTVFFQGERSSN